MQVCNDTNYKIRHDGSIFFRQYLEMNHKSLLGTSRLEQTYIPEICELINDDETFIKIEAIEGLQYILETLSVELIEKELVPSLLKLLNVNNVHDEVMIRMAEIIGPISYKLSKLDDMHLKYQPQILEFYSAICVHKSDECRRHAAYNLPAINQIYRNHLGESNCFTPQKLQRSISKDNSSDEESKDEEP
jgi:hypothetical protein